MGQNELHKKPTLLKIQEQTRQTVPQHAQTLQRQRSTARFVDNTDQKEKFRLYVTRIAVEHQNLIQKPRLQHLRQQQLLQQQQLPRQ